MSRKTLAWTFFGRSWLRYAGGLAAVAILLAVPALALAFLTPKLPWLTPGDPGVALSTSPVAFEAPTWAVAKVQARAQEVNRSVTAPRPDSVREEIIPIEEWTYTATYRALPAVPSPKPSVTPHN